MNAARSDPTRVRGDKGVVIVLFALVLVILMIFAAFAVDVSGVYSARRSDQSAADTAALGGLQTLLTPGSTGAQVQATVIDLVVASVGSKAATFDWNSCNTADDDIIDTAVNGKNCITTTASRDVLQVRIPLQRYPSSFAGVVGVNLDHSAFAIAGINAVGIGGVLPLPIGANAGDADGYVCVRTGSGGALDAIDPCNKQNTGNFGSADFGLWRDPECTANPKDRWALNVARGVDHTLSSYGPGKQPWGQTLKVDTTLCPGTVEQYPNGADTTSVGGVTTTLVASALFNGPTAGVPGRLALDAGSQLNDNDRTTIGSVSVDNNGLWEFITPGLDSAVTDVPESCEAHNFVPGDTELPAPYQAFFQANSDPVTRTRILLRRCISHYNGQAFSGVIANYTEPGGCGVARNRACTGVVFGKDSAPTKEGYDIQFTPRFGYVPQLHSDFTINDNQVGFAGFRPIYIQRLYGGQCTASCSWSFEPDPDTSPLVAYPPEPKAAGMTVFVLPRKALPGEIGSENAPFNIGQNVSVRLLR